MATEQTSFYFPIDCPWPSAESDKIKVQAEAKYKELVDGGALYVALISSSHWASEGYWVETKENKVSVVDQVVKVHANLKP